MNDRLVCELCPVLPACIGRHTVQCKNLYMYIVTYMKSGEGYSTTSIDLNGISWNGDRVLKVQGRFKKRIARLYKNDYSIAFEAPP